jgi:hypothetical protein
VTGNHRKLSAAEACLDDLKRQAAPPAGLNDFQLRRIWRSLQAEPRPRRPWLRWATVAGLLLLSSGAFAARATIASAVRRLLGSHPAESSQVTSHRTSTTTSHRTSDATTIAASSPADVPESPPPPPGARRPAVASHPRPGRTAAPARLALTTPGARSTSPHPGALRPADRRESESGATPEPGLTLRGSSARRGPSALAREAAMTGEAIRHLRRERDPTAALAALAAYRNDFPYGQLQREADRLTVDALLALDRRAEALDFLQRLDLGAGDDLPLRLLRGELAAPGGCAEAVADFTAVIAEATSALLERALLGRARCRDHLGDPAGSARDLAACQRRFPGGRCRGGTP